MKCENIANKNYFIRMQNTRVLRSCRQKTHRNLLLSEAAWSIKIPSSSKSGNTAAVKATATYNTTSTCRFNYPTALTEPYHKIQII